MLHLRALGALSLQRPDGADVLSVLAQPKRAALLVYLAATGRDGPLRRDSLIGLFWPELDEPHARAALSQALHYLRRSLGPGVLVTRGKDVVAVAPNAIWCDVVAFEQALDASDPARVRIALELYRGELLPGFYVPDAPEFERWLDVQRDRLRRQAADAAFALAAHEAASGRLGDAVRDARLGLELCGYSEERLRWTIELLDEAGDGAGAVQLYEHATEQLKNAYEIEPSAPTQRLIADVRARAAAAAAEVAEPNASRLRSTPTQTSSQRDAHGEMAPGTAIAGAPLPVIAPLPSPPRARRRHQRASFPPLALLAIAALALLAVVAIAAGRQLGERWWSPAAEQAFTSDSTPAPNRVAVLPFANFSADPAEEYLGDAVSAELISRLARLRAIRVISRSSVTAYAHSDKSVAEIARELRVRTVVEGSVLSAGDTLRIQVRIINGESEEPVWSRDYDVQRAELLAVQRRIAEDVAVGLSIEARPLTEQWLATRRADARAYEEYLHGRSLLGRIDRPSLLHARTRFLSAVEGDSTLAVAWSGLAQAYNHLAANNLMPAGEASRAARTAAERALLLDAELAEAHATLATVNSNYDWNAQGAERHFRRAIELDPSYADAYRAYANHLRNFGHFEQALALLRQAQDLDPLSPLPLLEEGVVHYVSRNFHAALRIAERLRLDHAQSPRAQLLVTLARIELGEFDEALAALDAADPEQRQPQLRSLRAYVLAKTGRTAEARQMLAALSSAPAKTPVSDFHLAIINIALGERNRAIELLEAAAAERSLLVRLLAVEPKADAIRGDPRFESLLRRVGLTAEAVSAATPVAGAQ